MPAPSTLASPYTSSLTFVWVARGILCEATCQLGDARGNTPESATIHEGIWKPFEDSGGLLSHTSAQALIIYLSPFPIQLPISTWTAVHASSHWFVWMSDLDTLRHYDIVSVKMALSLYGNTNAVMEPR